MFSIEKVIGKLAALKTAAEFGAVVPELADELARADIVIGDLKDRLEAALFDSPKEVSAIQEEISTVESQKGALRLALVGAQRRQQEAAAAEFSANLEAKGPAVKRARGKLHGIYLQLDQHLVAVVALLTSAAEIEREIKETNALLIRNGRRDLVRISPWADACSLMNFNQVTAAMNAAEMSPFSFRLPGYYPGGGGRNPLSRMKEVKL